MFRYKALLVIDLQKEFKDNNKKYEKVLNFVNDKMYDYDFLIGTIFQNQNNNFFKDKLNYTDCSNSSLYSSIEYNFGNHKCYHMNLKYGYSIDEGLIDYIKCHNIGQLDIVGCDSDACVLATCFRLFDEQVNFNVLIDYIYSSSENKDMNKNAIEIMKRNFGTCVN